MLSDFLMTINTFLTTETGRTRELRRHFEMGLLKLKQLYCILQKALEAGTSGFCDEFAEQH